MLGQVALGLAGIALGLHSIRKGAARLRGVALGEYSISRRRLKRKRMPQLGQVPTHVNTPSGDVRLRTYQIKSLDDRIAALRQLVQQGKRDPVIYEFARRAINGRCGKDWCVPEKSNGAEVEALFKAVRKSVRYTSDIAGIDSYQKPSHTLKFRTADCDDYASLTCALAQSIGLPCRFKVIRTKGAPEWNHIYAQIGLPRRNPTKWIAFDASMDMPLGWEAPASMVEASRVFHV